MKMESKEVKDQGDRSHSFGVNGAHDPGANGPHEQGVIGVHSFGVNGAHEVGLIGLNHHDALQTSCFYSNEGDKIQYDCHADRGLTLPQKRVLLWLSLTCNGKDKQFISFYKRIAAAVGITPRAAAVHVKALEVKQFIVTAPFYRIGTKQIIGKRVAVTKYAPSIKSIQMHFKVTEAEKLKRREMETRYAQTMEMWKLGLL